MFASLKGHVAVITGASKGIGRGIAKRFAEVGCSVCVVARGTGDAEKVVREISDAGGRRADSRQTFRTRPPCAPWRRR